MNELIGGNKNWFGGRKEGKKEGNLGKSTVSTQCKGNPDYDWNISCNIHRVGRVALHWLVMWPDLIVPLCWTANWQICPPPGLATKVGLVPHQIVTKYQCSECFFSIVNCKQVTGMKVNVLNWDTNIHTQKTSNQMRRSFYDYNNNFCFLKTLLLSAI